MKILIFFVVIIVYILIGLMGMFPHGYIASNGVNDYFQAHFTRIISFLVLFSLVLAWLFFENVKKVAKTKKELYVGTVLFGLFFFLFSFLYRDTQLVFYNNSGSISTVRVKGIITDKRIQYAQNRRSKQRTFFVTVTDSILRRETVFTVSDFVYKRTAVPDTFNKLFSVGRLGVLYRREEE